MAEHTNSLSEMPCYSLEDIQQLILFFSTNTYNATTEIPEYETITRNVMKLLKSDYNYHFLDNTSGELSYNYPRQIPIIESERECNQNVNPPQSAQRTTRTIYENAYDLSHINDLVGIAKLARCRCRFPVPVILYRGKYICRSSTLARGPEIYARCGYEYLKTRDSSSFTFAASTSRPAEDYPDPEDDVDGNVGGVPFLASIAQLTDEWQLFNKVRSQDIKLLKALNIGTIIDLMVENKKVKFGMFVTSSEKVDKENRYSDFNLISLPYPGCEFFKDFRRENLNSDRLFFNWDMAYIDASLCLPDDPNLSHLKINWNMYKRWDLTMLTKNYLKYLLKYFQDNTSGMLIHCISGWDRTPLFISLIRLSLWADGLIHKNLDEFEILYFTIGYDWMLFGHHLCNRLAKEEDIFIFCFHFLKHLASHDFSMNTSRSKRQKVADDNTKLDNDIQVDLLLENDPRGSNISLNSLCSSISTKSQETIMVYSAFEEPNGNSSSSASLDVCDNLIVGAPSSPLSRRTSPVTVPVASKLKRTESSTTASSVQSGGSWQHVTSTGSLKGSDSSTSQDSGSLSNTIDDDSQDSQPSNLYNRKDRLMKVRNIFYKAFWTTIGKDIPQYKSNPVFITVINEIAERMKYLTQRATS